MRIEYATLSDTGRVRERNEDACGGFVPGEQATLRERGALFVVADGMGGHRGGEVASRLAVGTIQASYFGAQGVEPKEALVRAFEEANTSILNQATADATLFGMGTTCTAMVINAAAAHFAHVGDSRAYTFRGGLLRQITQDHSLVGEMVRSGIISDEDARIHPKRNVITRSLGVQENVETDTPETPMPIELGDTFVLCSDGLTAYASNEDISRVLRSSPPEDACRQLVDMANQRGGRDNITVIVATVRNVDGDE